MEKLGGLVETTISFNIRKNPLFNFYDSSGNKIENGKKISTEGKELIFETSIPVSVYRSSDDCCEVRYGNICYKVKCSSGARIPGRCPCP